MERNRHKYECRWGRDWTETIARVTRAVILPTETVMAIEQLEQADDCHQPRCGLARV